VETGEREHRRQRGDTPGTTVGAGPGRNPAIILESVLHREVPERGHLAVTPAMLGALLEEVKAGELDL
jgi:hypothetical protein